MGSVGDDGLTVDYLAGYYLDSEVKERKLFGLEAHATACRTEKEKVLTFRARGEVDSQIEAMNCPGFTGEGFVQ